MNNKVIKLILVFIYGFLISLNLRFDSIYIFGVSCLLMLIITYWLRKYKLTLIIRKDYMEIMFTLLYLVAWTIYSYGFIEVVLLNKTEIKIFDNYEDINYYFNYLFARVLIVGGVILSFFEAKKE